MPAGGKPKLTELLVLQIRRERKTRTISYLAAKYGVTEPTISNICNYKTWKHVT